MAKIPRVLLIGDHPPPFGGVAVHVETLRKAVRAAGGEVAVLDIGRGQVPADGVYPAGGYARFAAQLASFAARGYLMHLHTSGANPKSWLLTAGCAAIARAAERKPIVTLHSGLGPDWLAQSRARRALAAAVLRSFGTVVAVSQPIAEALRRCGVAEESVLLAPAFSTAFLEPGELPRAAAQVREQAQPLLAAMLAPERLYGAEELLAAFASVRAARPRAHLVVFGPGTRPHELRPQAERLAGPSAASVHGLGEIARPAALAVMAACDVFLRPTLADGDSLSVREALALGRKVVCTSVGTRPPGVRLVPPGDAAALAEGILAVLEDPADGNERSFTNDGAELLGALLLRYGFDPPGAPAERAA